MDRTTSGKIVPKDQDLQLERKPGAQKNPYNQGYL